MKHLTSKIAHRRIDDIYRKLYRLCFEETNEYFAVDDVKEKTVNSLELMFCAIILAESDKTINKHVAEMWFGLC